MQWIVDGVYLAVAVLFIVGLKAMSSPAKARRGITWAGVGMVLAHSPACSRVLPPSNMPKA